MPFKESKIVSHKYYMQYAIKQKKWVYFEMCSILDYVIILFAI